MFNLPYFNWLFLILGVFVVVSFVVFAIKFFPAVEEALPYHKRKYLLTLKERELFELLKQIVQDRFYIFPQIHLASIIEVDRGEKEWRKYFNKIISKSIDFVIFDKQNMSPVLAIELDDKTHEWDSRIVRDEFVNAALKSAGISMLRIKTAELSNPAKIKADIESKLVSKV